MTRVCLVTGSFPSMDCGVGDYSWQLAQHLAEHVSVTVLTSDRPVVRGFLARTGAPVLRASRGGRLEVRPAIRSWSMQGLLALCRAVIACRPDVLHIQYATSAFDLGAGANWLARALRRVRPSLPIVTTLHDPSGPRLFPKAGPLREAQVRLLCRESDRVCCPDLLVLQWLAANNMGERGRLIPVGVNVEPLPREETAAAATGLARARERLERAHPGLFAGGPVLVSFGNLHPQKDYRTVVQALRRLWVTDAAADAGGEWERARWVLVGGSGRGEDTGQAAAIRALADEAGLGDRVRLAGYCPPSQVSDWMAAADACVLLLPQGATDARSSLLVALAHGKATVVVGPGVFSAHMREGEHLFCPPPGDVERLAAILDGLVRDPARRDRLGQAARRLTDRHYGWPSIAAATIDVYRELVPTKRVPMFGGSRVPIYRGADLPRPARAERERRLQRMPPRHGHTRGAQPPPLGEGEPS